MSPAAVLTELNRLGGNTASAVFDLQKIAGRRRGSRGCHETPGGTIMLRAHRAIESITLDREVAHLKDDLMPRYASMIYNGYWWSPERVALQTLIDHTQQTVNGWYAEAEARQRHHRIARLKTDSLFDMKISTFDEDGGAYNQADAGGFIKLTFCVCGLRRLQRRSGVTLFRLLSAVVASLGNHQLYFCFIDVIC